MSRSSAFAALVLLAVAGACTRPKSKAEQLAALDEAYQSGVLTKQEYDAKRTAIAGPPVAAVEPQPAKPSPIPAPAPEPPPRKTVAPSPPAAPPEPEPTPPAAGCDADTKSGREKGPQERFFAAPVARVKRAAESALDRLDFAIHQNSSNEIQAGKRRHIGAIIGKGGERVTLHFQAARRGDRSGTLVTGETKKALVGRLTQKSWTTAVLAQMECVLEGRK
jgi:hypothetical protein